MAAAVPPTATARPRPGRRGGDGHGAIDDTAADVDPDEHGDATTDRPRRPSVVCPSYRPNETLPLRLCDKGDAVRAVQQRLREPSPPIFSSTGTSDRRPSRRCAPSSSCHGLEVDGLVGPDSWSALFAGVEQTPVYRVDRWLAPRGTDYGTTEHRLAQCSM